MREGTEADSQTPASGSPPPDTQIRDMVDVEGQGEVWQPGMADDLFLLETFPPTEVNPKLGKNLFSRK